MLYLSIKIFEQNSLSQDINVAAMPMPVMYMYILCHLLVLERSTDIRQWTTKFVKIQEDFGSR